MRKALYLLIICTALIMLCSCSNAAKETSVPNDHPAPEFSPLNEVVDGRTDIYLITKLLDSNYWDIVEEGAKDAGNEFGCNVYHSGTDNEMDWQTQIKLLDKCVELGADAIILAPNDSTELTPKLEEIRSKNIPVILIDTIVNSDSFDICYMTDNLEAGNIAAKEMLNRLHAQNISEDEAIKIGILAGTDKTQTINERLAGFYQYWTENAPAKWVIISDIQNCNGDMKLAEQLVDDLLKDHPDIRGLFVTNNGPTKVTAQKILDKGYGKVSVVGFDFSDEIKKLMETPEHNASTILQRQYYMSYDGVKTALDLIDGSAPEVRFVDTGVITVNSENIMDPDIQNIIEGKNDHE